MGGKGLRTGEGGGGVDDHNPDIPPLIHRPLFQSEQQQKRGKNTAKNSPGPSRVYGRVCVSTGSVFLELRDYWVSLSALRGAPDNPAWPRPARQRESGFLPVFLTQGRRARALLEWLLCALLPPLLLPPLSLSGD